MLSATLIRDEQLVTDSTAFEPMSPASTTSLLPSPDAALSSPTAGSSRVRHHLIPARPSTCIRAPCLKRNSSSPIPESTLTAHIIAGAPVATEVISSFAPPRCVSYSGPRRQVHFDDSEPEQFLVHSGSNYDRRPIECTQGGSEFDMSLPPRCTSYNLSDDEANDDSEPGEDPSQDVGPIQDPTLEGWSCLKNGTVIASAGYQPSQPSQQTGLTSCGKSMHSSLWNSMQSDTETSNIKSLLRLASAGDGAEQAKKDQVSLPVHGFRSFGGLSNTFASSKPSILSQANPEHTPSAAKLASPDATPMPSPSIYKTLTSDAFVGYFGRSEGLSSRVAEKTTSGLEQPFAAHTVQSLPEPLASEERLRALDSDTILVLNQSAASLSLERKLSDQGRQSTLAVPRAAELTIPTARSGWTSALGLLSSPLSSRCSSVDPWSNHSSDIDGDGTDSPSNEASWISSSCTSPDLAPTDRMGESHKDKVSPSALSSWLDGNKAAEAEAESESVSADSKHSQSSPAARHADVADDHRFSSSVKTVSAIHLAQRKTTDYFNAVITDDVWMSENSTPDISRRPSLQHYELEPFQLAPRMKTRKVQHAISVATVGEGSVLKTRTRSSSRDGTLPKKSRSSKCKACRLVREREKAMVANNALPSDFCGSPETGSRALHEASSPTLSLMSLDETIQYSPTKPQHSDSPAQSRSRSSSKTRSLSTSRTRQRSGDRVASPSESPSWVDSPTVSAAEESPSPRLISNALPLECTCDKRKEKDALRRKMRKERELEKERDREWERDQARGRQRRLFGDSSCLSALDGF